MGHHIYDLLCQQTMALRKCGYFNIYLHLFRDGKELLLPGTLLVSIQYFYALPPVIVLRREGSRFGILLVSRASRSELWHCREQWSGDYTPSQSLERSGCTVMLT